MKLVLIILLIVSLLALRVVLEGLTMDVTSWGFKRSGEDSSYSKGQRVIQMITLLCFLILIVWAVVAFGVPGGIW